MKTFQNALKQTNHSSTAPPAMKIENWRIANPYSKLIRIANPYSNRSNRRPVGCGRQSVFEESSAQGKTEYPVFYMAYDNALLVGKVLCYPGKGMVEDVVIGSVIHTTHLFQYFIDIFVHLF